MDNTTTRVQLSARAAAGIIGLAALLALLAEAPGGDALAQAIAWLVFIGAAALYGPQAVKVMQEVI